MCSCLFSTLVAVALRNQKVTLPRSSKDIVRLSDGLSISPLREFTICFEIARSAQRDIEIIFSINSEKGYAVAFGKTQGGMALFIDNKECSIESLINSANFTSTMKPLCLTWTSTTGQVALHFNGNYRTEVCGNLKNRIIDLQGLQLGAGGSGDADGQSDEGDEDVGSFDGFIYNFRIWSKSMASSELSSLTCDSIGDLVDWDNNFWDIPSSYALTDNTLSCSKYVTICTVQLDSSHCISHAHFLCTVCSYSYNLAMKGPHNEENKMYCTVLFLVGFDRLLLKRFL